MAIKQAHLVILFLFLSTLALSEAAVDADPASVYVNPATFADIDGDGAFIEYGEAEGEREGEEMTMMNSELPRRMRAGAENLPKTIRFPKHR
nr:hypothetical protein Iba_chr03cCG12300 [Ipomoea batatas]